MLHLCSGKDPLKGEARDRVRTSVESILPHWEDARYSRIKNGKPRINHCRGAWGHLLVNLDNG